MDYAAHIARVCKIEDIEIEWRDRLNRSLAWRRRRKIRIRPVKTAITYAVALHEIGHILGPRQNGTRLDKEVGAWEWAMANAIEWTDTMSQVRAKGLKSYLAKVNRCTKMKKAGPDHPIYSLI